MSSKRVKRKGTVATARLQRDVKKLRADIKARPPRRRNKQPPNRRRRNNYNNYDNIARIVGRGLRTVMTTLAGFGDYKVNGNSLMTGGMDPPMIVNSVNNGGFIVRHREYLQDINATTAFNNQVFTINPGVITTFPWLSTLAQNFEQYRIRGMVFEFKSLSSDALLLAASSSALGSVIMATQYDVVDPPFPNKFEMANYEFANSAKPSLSFLHPIECAKGQTSVNELYIRNGPLPTNYDPRLYDLGNFNIATVGMQVSTGVCGELWVSYEIELFKPKLTNESELLRTDHWNGTAFSPSDPFDAAVAFPGNTLHMSFPQTGSFNQMVFPNDAVNGQYLIVYFSTGASTLIGVPVVTYVGCRALLGFANSTAPVAQIPTGVTSTAWSWTSIVQVTSSPATITWGAATFPYTSGYDIYITELNPQTSPKFEIEEMTTDLECEAEEEEEDDNSGPDEYTMQLLRRLGIITDANRIVDLRKIKK